MTGALELSARDLVSRYAAKTLSPVETLRELSARIEAHEPAVNAFRHLDLAAAEAAAQASERRWREGAPLGALDGVPFSVKDNIAVAGAPTRFGSRLTADAPASADAPVVARMRAAGAICFGKTAMPEFGWKAVADSPLTGVTRNPWDARMTPGGSSGGAAAAAALGLGPVHLGTDGGGSIRIPASFSGCFGHKPSRGLTPVAPPSPLGSLFHVGPLTRDVRDAALVLSVIAGGDPRDPFAWPGGSLAIDEAEKGVRGVRIAYAPGFAGAAKIDPEVESAVAADLDALADLGAEVTEAEPALSADPLQVWETIWWSVAAMLMADFGSAAAEAADPDLFEAAEKKGRSITGAALSRAQRDRILLQGDLARFHESYDLLVTPTTPIPAFETGRSVPASGEWGEAWCDWAPYSYPFNLTMQPAASAPCGLTEAGLPIGLQIVGRLGEDALVLAACRALELARPFPRLAVA